MKTRFINIIFVVCCILLAVVITGCSKNTQERYTIVLLGPEPYVVPLSEYLSEDIADDFKNNYGDMPTGYIPPDIEGQYLISPKTFCYSNFINLSDDQDMHLRVTNQHNRIATVELDDRGIVKTDTAFIMGNAQYFTMYFVETREMDFYSNVSQVERCVIVSGEKTDLGIKDLKFGTIILKTSQGSNPYIGNFNVGSYFIYKDGNNLAENCDWFDNN